MNKTIILCLIVLLSTTPIMAKEFPINKEINYTHEQVNNARAHKNHEFEEKLGLTEAQKAQAKELRKKGNEKIRPIIQQIKMKEMEKKIVHYSQPDQQKQQAQISKINEEIKILQRQAAEIRKQNMKEFEAILTPEQKNTLKAMKKEGRKKYRANHPAKLYGLPKPSI